MKNNFAFRFGNIHLNCYASGVMGVDAQETDAEESATGRLNRQEEAGGRLDWRDVGLAGVWIAGKGRLYHRKMGGGIGCR
ncbi:hypothetical protein E3N88_31979 [Mikania micrantha]|uniref:Uncharacterized protein n=1 Tax=Mikania micrantha TaxID=192012 RepID=A0A5N6M774_9ASTR|nr:hypothetical protein E3N88_31979 [Mikania micrantha]